MPHKKPTKAITEPVNPLFDGDNSNTRSGFGDNHAATEDALLVAHAEHMRQLHIIDDRMAAELSKPRRNVSEVQVKYTDEYLAMHPNYTGKNACEMPSLEVAQKRQKARDEAMLKQLKNFRAGKSGRIGNFMAGRSNPLSSEHDIFCGSDGQIYNTTIMTSDSATSSRKKGNYEEHTRHKSNKRPVVKFVMVSKPCVKLAPPCQSASSSSFPNQPCAQRKRKRLTRDIIPLEPSSGQSRYSQYCYYELLAICRQRKIPSRGCEQAVRNALIQDDWNVVLGKERKSVKSIKRRRLYKTVALDVQALGESASR